jgi:hypothetical protein
MSDMHACDLEPAHQTDDLSQLDASEAMASLCAQLDRNSGTDAYLCRRLALLILPRVPEDPKYGHRVIADLRRAYDAQCRANARL